ncbi:PVC-type heme-binding CxxCH protein [Stratiformator vulcanicus]|nr:PVC-type heme-binding CxxCH protein [Stratiformator vulcanicus]
MIRQILLFLIATSAAFQLAPSRSAAEALVEIAPNERIALVGNGLAERMRLFGNFEAMLQSNFPEKAISVRNFGWPADEVGKQQRPNDYTHIDDPLKVYSPDRLICFFGFNESFAGPEGIDRFRRNLKHYVKESTDRLDRLAKPQFVFVSPIAYESTGDPHLPEGVEENENLALYADAMREVAAELEVPFVDLFTPTKSQFAKQPGNQYTTDGVHLNADGDLAVATLLSEALFGESSTADPKSATFEHLREAIVDKEWHHQQDYRMVNGWYVYGGRSSPFGEVNFPEEYAKIRQMVALRQERIWKIARGEKVSEEVDDSQTLPLKPVPSTFGTKTYSEPEDLRFLSPEEALGAMTVAPGYRVQTFADEERFPELANPVQINFDNKGRLWASCMPTYPQWHPNEARPNDRLLIFEDTDGDGRADDVKVFADDLHIPTGFAFWNGGVIVVDQPRLVFLKDTDGDDRADVKEVLLDGFATDDTHHAIGAFELTPGGEVLMLEGVSMSTAVETPRGPFRNHGRSTIYRYDPRTRKIEKHIQPAFANPWCATHNDWGQQFVGDGTGATQFWATPLSGKVYPGRKGIGQFVHYSGGRMRPAIGCEFLFSRHFPEEARGNYIYACVINLNGILQFEVEDEGAGYRGDRITDIVNSTDRNFRPADPQIAPDGTLYFADWHNPLIGHMQYSQRDPNRDHRHGRIYRLSAVDRPTVEPATQHGKSIEELLEQFREYEPRTRERARRELRDRDSGEVAKAIDRWAADLDETDPLYDQLLTNALWVQQGHHRVTEELAQYVLNARTPDARAAGINVVVSERAYLPTAFQMIAPLVDDDHPRVRLEVVRAMSFFPTNEAIEVALRAADKPMDEMLDYTLESTLAANESVWRRAIANGISIGSPKSKGRQILARLAGKSDYGPRATKVLKQILEGKNLRIDRKLALYDSISSMSGDHSAGAKVFKRACAACHKAGEAGAKYAPNLSDVGKRLKPAELVESILYPNAKLNPDYQTVNVLTVDGIIVTGLIVEETDEAVTVHVGADKIKKVPQDDIEEIIKVRVSSMPEKLNETMSGEEFVDLLAFLKSRRTKP